MQLCSMIFESTYKYMGNVSYTENDPYTPFPTPTIPLNFYHNFFAKRRLHWIFSTLFYIKYGLFCYQICLCCNFFYGYPEFATFLLNYYKKSSNDKIFHLKFKKIRQDFYVRGLCFQTIFSFLMTKV